jgi:uncharacterized repeat protein (TIGR03847 family)
MDIGRVEKITADAVGDPGERTFYIQARGPDGSVTVIVEKEQVRLLAGSIDQMLETMSSGTGDGPDEEQMELEPPLEADFRAGRLSIGFEEETDLFLLELEEQAPELEEDDPEQLLMEEPQLIRLWATREQMKALARHGAAVVERGRPTCRYCGNPMDPKGHICPAMNGHSKH